MTGTDLRDPRVPSLEPGYLYRYGHVWLVERVEVEENARFLWLKVWASWSQIGPQPYWANEPRVLLMNRMAKRKEEPMTTNPTAQLRDRLPADLTPVNLKAWLFNALGFCICFNWELALASLVRILDWHAAGDSKDAQIGTVGEALYSDPGAFYLIAGLLDSAGLTEHGTTMRGGAWLTADGKRLLAALRKHTPEAIATATGDAYDGSHHLDMDAEEHR